MAIPQFTDNMPAYFIYRDVQPGEPFDPTASLLFMPPKGSDDLFDALRLAFPHLKSNSERMRQAVIQFLVDEREAEQSLQTSPAMTADSTWPSLPTGCAPSVLSTPETNNLSTPASFAPSPQTFATQLTRQASTATNASQSASPPAIDQMTSVFSLSTSTQPKQRLRRKMTEAEKVEYRKRRIVKACDKCAKRKRKCPHNQTEMETITSDTGKSNSKVSKSTSPKSTKSPSASQQQAAFDPSILLAEDVSLENSFNFGDFAPTEDFALFQDFQDPFENLNMDSFMSYDHFDTSNSYPTADFFSPDLLASPSEWQHTTQPTQAFSNSTQRDQSAWESEYGSSPSRHGSNGSLNGRVPFANIATDEIGMPPIDSMFSSIESLSSEDDRQRQFVRAESGHDSRAGTSQFGMLSPSDSDEKQLTSGTYGNRNAESSGGNGNGNGNGMLWEHLRTGQMEKPVPTHTAHVHDTESQEDPATLASVPRPTERIAATSHEPQPAEDVRWARSSSPTSLANVNRQEARLSTTREERGSSTDLHVIKQGREHFAAAVNELGLASTSVSVSNGLRSEASRQGRPPLSSRHINANVKDRSLGHGLPEIADASSQLYMARKRILPGLTTTTPRLQTIVARQEGLDILGSLNGQQAVTTLQANGGAYPRRVEAETSASKSSTAMSIHAVAQSAVSMNLHEKTDRRHSAGLTSACQAERQLSNAAIHVEGNTGELNVHQDRLRDTNKFKDHHGRNAGLSSYLLAMFGCALLLHAASLLSSTISCTALILALIAPHQESSQASSSFNKIVRCTTKNSRWLVSSFASLTETKYGLADPAVENSEWISPSIAHAWSTEVF